MNRRKKFIVKYDTIPNKENVDYAFQRLITSLAIAIKFEPYKESFELLKKCLDDITNWNIIFDETGDLSKINIEEINEIDYILYELDGKYLSAPGLYIENAYIWFEQLQILRNNYIERKQK